MCKRPWLTALMLMCWIAAPYCRAQDVQKSRDAAVPEVAAIQEKVLQAIARAEKSVVAIARVGKDQADTGFQIPNLGRLNLAARLDESLPTNADYVPADYAAGIVIETSGTDTIGSNNHGSEKDGPEKDGLKKDASKNDASEKSALIVTTYHALGNVAGSDFFVWVDHKPFRAQVLAADGWFDLAVLKVEKVELTPIKLGDAKLLKKGQFVIALGNPLAMGRDGQSSAAWGIVANLRRRAPRVPERSRDPAGRETVHHYGTLIQTDIRLTHGFSGGALINLDGELVGLTTVYSGGPTEEESAGLAFPVDEYFKQALGPLKSGKSPEFGFLGVGPQPLNLRLRQQDHHGAIVETVMPGTPASRGEIQIGDVITHAEGEPLYDDDDLFRIIGSLPPDSYARLTMYRGDISKQSGTVLHREVKLSKKQVTSLRPSITSVPPETWRGMRVDYATVAAREMLQNDHLPPEGCLYVIEVQPDSPAWKAGIQPGMFVLRVNGRPVTTPKEFFEAVSAHEGESSLLMSSGNTPAALQTVSP